jgi:hypothetical protein
MIYNVDYVQRIQTILTHYIFDEAPPFTIRKVWNSIRNFDKSCNRITPFSYKDLDEYIQQLYVNNKFGKDWVFLKRKNKTDYYFRIPKPDNFIKLLKEAKNCNCCFRCPSNEKL